MHGKVVDALRMREEDNTSKSHKKRLRCASKTLKERVDERGDGTFITKERALQMVHKHEIYDLKRKTAIEAVNKFRNLKTENEQKNNPWIHRRCCGNNRIIGLNAGLRDPGRHGDDREIDRAR